MVTGYDTTSFRLPYKFTGYDTISFRLRHQVTEYETTAYKSFFFFFFGIILRLLTKQILQMQDLKLKNKYITILHIGSKLHKDEKE